MPTKFPYLSRFVCKILEVAGAGLASAIAGFLLGHMSTPPAPPVPAPMAVRFAPADEEMVRLKPNEHARLVEFLQNDMQTRNAPDATAPPAAAATASTGARKPAKPMPAQSSHREQKTECCRVTAMNDKARAGDPLQIRPMAVAAARADLPAGGAAQSPATLETQVSSPAASVVDESRLVSALKQIPAWFWPASDRVSTEAPRPPLPVGQFLQSTM
jgi:hypothetical protein